MLSPKHVAPSKGKQAWFECPYCYELFEEFTSKVKGYSEWGNRISCGCVKAAESFQPSIEDRGALRWLDREIKGEKEDLPPLLKKLGKRRRIAYEWNLDMNNEAKNNFINFISPRPANAELSWKDPLGPIEPDNFEWKLNADKSRTN